MKRKSFGKLAIVSLLAVLMLFGFASCSKKAETPSTTTTTSTTATTTTTTTTTTPAPAAATTTTATVVEEKAPVVEETVVEAPVVEETVVETPVVEETVVETPVVEETVVETPVVEETVVAEEEVPEYSTVFSYNGITAAINAYKDNATVSVPAGVTEEDIDKIASLLLSAYPEAAECTYEVKDGTLYLTYPEQAMATVEAAVETLSGEAVKYISAIADAVSAAEETVAAVGEVVDSTELQILENGTIICTYNYHDLATAKVVVEDEKTTITYPAEYVYKSDIEAFIAELVEEYPSLAEHVSYEIPEDGTLVLYYAENYVGNTTYDRLSLLASCDVDLTSCIDELLGEDEVVIAEEVVEPVEEEEEVPVFSSIFTYSGVTSNIVAFNDYAILTLPEGVTEDDIATLAALLVEAYPEAELVTYEISDDCLYLFYPEQSDEFVLAAVVQLESDAKYVIDSMTVADEESAVAKITPVEAETVAPVEEAPVEEAPVDVTPVAEPVAPVPPVAAPVAVEEKGKFIQEYSVALTGTPKGNLESGKFVFGLGLRAEAKFNDYVSAGVRFDADFARYRKTLGFGAYVRGTYSLTDALDIYALFGVSGVFGIDKFSGTNAFALNFGAGVEYRFAGNFSAFAEFTGRYAFNDAIKLDLGGTVGVKYTF